MTDLAKFGQYVSIEILRENGEVVLSTDSLRIDFDTREMHTYSRAKVTVYNLSEETNLALVSDEAYITVKVGLHGEKPYKIIDSMYISNVINTRVVPDSTTTMYCYSKVKKVVLEKQVSIKVQKPSLQNIVRDVLTAGNIGGEFEFLFFPQEILTEVPLRPVAMQEGSVGKCLDVLSKQYKFKYFTNGAGVKIGYIVDPANYDATDLSKEAGSIVLNTKNMRSNPKLGPASLEITSNLDSRIEPLKKLNIKKLVSAQLTGFADEGLFAGEGVVLSAVSGRSIYQVLFVQHKGSNWANEWSTIAQAVTPNNGTNMNTYNWFR